MSIAIDTDVLVRRLVRDDEAQFAAARQMVDQAAAGDEPVLIVLGALLETEWVLRNRYRLDKASIAGAFNALLESGDVEFEHPPTVACRGNKRMAVVQCERCVGARHPCIDAFRHRWHRLRGTLAPWPWMSGYPRNTSPG